MLDREAIPFAATEGPAPPGPRSRNLVGVHPEGAGLAQDQLRRHVEGGQVGARRVLEDRGRVEEAAEAYRDALASDPALGGAHFNLAGLLERSGDVAGAVRHFSAYRRLGGEAASGGAGS